MKNIICSEIAKCPPEQIARWIKDGKRCWKCGRTNHKFQECTLKKPCGDCSEVHLQVLHRVAQQGPSILHVASSDKVYLTNSNPTGRVYLKIVPVLLQNGRRSLKTYAILDDGAERTILLPAAAQHLELQGREESLALRTIRHDIAHLTGSSVDFQVSPITRPDERHTIKGAFTATRLSLAEQSYPVEALQKRYRHLRGIPLIPFKRVNPLILIGSDYTSLITATEPVRLGPAGGPAAVHTPLGWALQGPDGLLPHRVPTPQCYLMTLGPTSNDIYQQVE